MFAKNSIKMLVCDMAGTVYKKIILYIRIYLKQSKVLNQILIE